MNWIKCSDRLPQCDEVVLCRRKDECIFVAIYDNWTDSLESVSDFYLANIKFGELGKLKLGKADEWNSGYGEITHWMPLPEPPKDIEAFTPYPGG